MVTVVVLLNILKLKFRSSQRSFPVRAKHRFLEATQRRRSRIKKKVRVLTRPIRYKYPAGWGGRGKDRISLDRQKIRMVKG